MEDIRKYLLLFFNRPMEPCFMPKGEENIAFKVPAHYYPKYYNDVLKLLPKDGPVMTSVVNDEDFAAKFSDTIPWVRIIDIHEVDVSELSLALELPKLGQFSIFLPKHRKIAARLVDVFMEAKDLDTLLSLAVYCQLNFNPFLFVFSLAVALLHRPDTKGIELPSLADIFPAIFVDRDTLNRARELIYVLPDAIKTPVVVVDPPKVYIPEQRVAYFRDDFGINCHHWHWHLVYPGIPTKTEVVNKDRRGELFYYMHHQIVARYNTERLCNDLERSKPFDDFHSNIVDGVFPHMNTSNASRSWPLRFDNVVLKDVHRDGSHLTIVLMETWRNRIMEAIHNMAVLKKDGTFLALDDETGIDILGNLVESTDLSVNKDYYGSYHNEGHDMISVVHDPNGYHGEDSTIMGDTATAIRDPIFYRWHAHIDKIFFSYKDKLTPYEHDHLAFPEITVASVELKGVDGEDIDNSLSTLWERSDINLANGLDFSRKREVYARLTYLQHADFQYVIEVNNNTGKPQMGTVRIFMAPVLDEKGVELHFEEQRKLMIEMDKFSHPLTTGKNIIHRRSTESSVTVPYERVLKGRKENVCAVEAKKSFYCDCGWPQNMLVPKGNQAGYQMVLFVMVSNWNVDKVDQDEPKGCKDNASYCGLRDRKYPDRRAMGFPFDRRAGAASLPDFLLPNMAVQSCTIKFTDIIVDKDGKPF